MLQLGINILLTSGCIIVVAIGFSLIFSTARFFHFAHAAVIAAGAYCLLVFYQWMALPIYLAVPIALMVGTGIGWCLEWAVYRPMRRRGASPLILLLASLGLYILLQNIISMRFEDDTKVISGGAVAPTFEFFGARITVVQITVILVAVLLFVAKELFIDRTRIGLALRAVANSPELATLSGVEYDKTMTVAFCLGSFLAAAAGIFQAFDVGMTPTMGLPMLLLGVVAVVLGGSGNVLGVALASLLLAACQQLAAWQLGTQWQETAAFILLLAFLLFRPQGIVGKHVRNAEV